ESRGGYRLAPCRRIPLGGQDDAGVSRCAERAGDGFTGKPCGQQKSAGWMRLDDRPRMEASGAGVVVELETQVRRTRLPLNTGPKAPVVIGAQSGVKLNSRNDIEQMAG